MSSPFSVFRKHQKGLMAGLIIVAMVSFIVLGTVDQFFQRGSGGDTGEDRVVATWKGGKFTQKDLSQLVYSRAALNSFIRGVKEMEAQNRSENRIGPHPQYNTTIEAELIRTTLLEKEAEKLGVVVTDEQVTQFIKRLSGDSVTDAQLNTILRQLSSRERPITFPQLIEAQRRELVVDQVKLLLGSPDRDYDDLATPAQRWDYFCRLNRRVKLQIYPIRVEQYLSDARIPDPKESDLLAFYEAHKNDVASPASPDPGFKEPTAVKLEYLKADYVKFVDAAKARLTEDEIRKDFEKYKQTMRTNLEIDERMDSLSELLNADDEKDKKDKVNKDQPDALKTAENSVPKAPEPDETEYEKAVGKFAKRAPRATEPRFTDEEVLHRNRESIVKRLAETKARDDMRKALDDAFGKMSRFAEVDYRKWFLANVPKEGEEAKDATPKSPPPTFDLAKLANPEIGLTYHQTALMSDEMIACDKYLGATFVNRRWGMVKDPQTGIESSRIVDEGSRLVTYAFQTKTTMNPFRGEDEVAGSAEGFYRNQYVMWKTEYRPEHVPEFADIKDRVKRAWKIANTTGKSARDFARQSAERLAQDINGNKTTLKTRLADNPDVKETKEFTWYEDTTVPTGFGALPSVRLYPSQTRLDEVEVGERRFFSEVFRLQDKQAGAAMNDAGSIVYVVQVFDAADSTPDILRAKFARTPYNEYRQGLSFFMQGVPDEQGYALASIYDMARRTNFWYEQLERDYDVKWQAAATQ